MQEVSNLKVRRRQLSAIEETLVDSSSCNPSPQCEETSTNHNEFLLRLQCESTLQLHHIDPFIVEDIKALQQNRQTNVYKTMTVEESGLNDAYLDNLIQYYSNRDFMGQVIARMLQKQEGIEKQIVIGSTLIEGEFRLKTCPQETKNRSYVIHLRSSQTSKKHSSRGTIFLKTQPTQRQLTVRQLHQMFKAESAQTQLASEYVKTKKVEQRQIRQRLERARDDQQRRQQSEERQRKQNQSKQQSKRRQSLLKLISERMLRRQQYKQKGIERETNFKRIMKQYAKPLFQKRHEEYLQRASEEKKKQDSKMEQLRGRMRGASLEQLNSFAREYLEKKEERNRAKEIERQRLRTEELLNTKNHYRSIFHQFIQKNSMDSVRSDIEKERYRRQRRQQYSREVKEKISVPTDPRLKQELAALIQEQERKYKRPQVFRQDRCIDRSSIHSQLVLSKPQQVDEPNPRQDGLRFLKFARQRRNKTVEMKQLHSGSSQHKTEVTLNHSYSKPARLNDHELLAKFICGVRQSSCSQSSKRDLLKAKAYQLDEKAHRSQQLLRIQSSGEARRVRRYLNPQQYYLDSIRTKIQFLRL